MGSEHMGVVQRAVQEGVLIGVSKSGKKWSSRKTLKKLREPCSSSTFPFTVQYGVSVDCTHGKRILADAEAFKTNKRILRSIKAFSAAHRHLTNAPEQISVMTSLRELNLSWNYFDRLPEELCALSKLRTLDLTGNDLQELPPALFSLTNLRTLLLSRNSIEELPVELGRLSQLRTLKVADNQLDSLPDELDQCVELRHLDLGQNQISQLPDSFCTELTKLMELHLCGNWFNELPAAIWLLPKLKKLDVSRNSLYRSLC